MRHCSRTCSSVDAAESVPAHDLRRGHAPLRLRQARPAQPARARRRRRSRRAAASSRCSPVPRRIRRAASRRCACRAAARCTRKEIDDYTAFVGALRREGPRVHQGQRDGEGPRRPAVADPEVPAATTRSRAFSSAPAPTTAISSSSARTARRSSTTRSARCGSSSGADLKLTAQTTWQPLWVVDFPMFEWDAGRKRWVADASSVHRAGE